MTPSKTSRRKWCARCEASLTSTDYEAGFCTQCGYKLENRTMSTTTATPWEWANDSPVWLQPRRTVYFLVRHVGDNHNDWTTGKVEYRTNKRGHVITYGTREQAIRIQDKLNGESEQ